MAAKARIALANDHGGVELKNAIKEWLLVQGYEVIDLGIDVAESTDYPIWGEKCGRAVVNGEADKGIVVCGSGIGISIAANKVSGVRCALVTSAELAYLAKNHNDANIISFGGRTTSIEDAIEWTKVWLETEFDGGERHLKRVKMITEM